MVEVENFDILLYFLGLFKIIVSFRIIAIIKRYFTYRIEVGELLYLFWLRILLQSVDGQTFELAAFSQPVHCVDVLVQRRWRIGSYPQTLQECIRRGSQGLLFFEIKFRSSHFVLPILEIGPDVEVSHSEAVITLRQLRPADGLKFFLKQPNSFVILSLFEIHRCQNVAEVCGTIRNFFLSLFEDHDSVIIIATFVDRKSTRLNSSHIPL